LLQDYTLIIDEVPECETPVDYYFKDRQAAEKLGYISLDNNSGILSWNPRSYGSGVFSGMKKLIKNNRIVQTTDGNRNAWVQELDPDMLTSFSDCYVLTYLFYCSTFYKYLLKHQAHFLLIDSKPFELYHIENNSFAKGYRPATAEDKRKYRNELITINHNPNWNDIGERWSDLSSQWYKTHSIEERTAVFNKSAQFFRYPDIPKQPTKETPVVIMWTCFKKYAVGAYVPKGMRGKVKIRKDKDGIEYKDVTRASYVPCNMRASNEYRTRTHIAFLVNVFLHPVLKDYLKAGDIERGYALSSMLQWVWRSAIRENQPINIFIPSSRMRNLFADWLSKDDDEYLATF